MKQPLVSVIVPIYNTEQYLTRCIESILTQSYTTMEIFLVNDGSTDNSGKICDDYAVRDTRIHIIHQANRGIIAAKKAALKRCCGKYVLFVDSDDWIEQNHLASMVRHMLLDECDLVCSNVQIDMDGKTTEKRNMISTGVYKTENIAKDLFYYKETDMYGILPYSVAKLFPRKMLCNVMKNIGDDIRYAEDKAIVFGFVFQNIKVRFLDDIEYHYCIRKDSACYIENPDFLVELTAFYKYARKLFQIHKERDFLLRQLGRYLLNEVQYTVNYRLGLTAEGRSLYEITYEFDPSIFFMEEKNVILYGAGRVGTDYYKKLADCMKLCLCAWVDQNYEQYRENGFDVQPVEYIKSCEYDYILVAVNNESVFCEIKEELKSIGVIEDKIIWGKPLKTLQYW